MNLAVHRDTHEHYREHDRGESGHRNDKHERRFYIDRERHYHRAEYDERRAQDETQGQVCSGLNLIYVARQAGYKRRRAERIELGIRELADMLEERVADVGSEAD